MLIWQLADAAFPTGGFAHSSGFEALRALGHLGDEPALALRLEELAWHTAYAALPFLAAAHAGDAIAADHACDRFTTSHVANRASRAQGKAFLLAAGALFDHRPALPLGHLPVAIGAALAPELPVDDCRALAMYTALRAAVSAAIRLGVIGPLRAQRVLRAATAIGDRALAATRGLLAADARAAAPLLELAQAAHDRLYSRMFQS
jgi:urease accessory protein